MHSELPTKVDAKGLRIGLAVSRYHGEVTASMREAAVDAFVRAGGAADGLVVVPAAGTWELTAICKAMASKETQSDKPLLDAIVALGCVITGQTPHDQYICQSVIQGLTQITVATGIPIAFGVLTCRSMEQARERSIEAAVKGGVNKGAEAMIAAIQTAQAIKTLATKGLN